MCWAWLSAAAPGFGNEIQARLEMGLVERITNAAAESGIIEDEDREIYLVTITSMLFSFLTWGTLLLLGIIFNCIIGCVLFLVLYLPLRIFAGGFHCSSRKNCYMFSLAIFALILLAYAAGVTISASFQGTLLLISAFLVFALAPIQDKNKPLTESDTHKYMRYARTILTVELLIVVAIHVVFRNSISHEIVFFTTVSFKLVAFQLVLGAVKNRIIHRNTLSDA